MSVVCIFSATLVGSTCVYCECTLLYVNSWAGSGIIVTGTCVRFPLKGVFTEAVWTLWSMCNRHFFNTPGKTVSELTLNDFLRTNQPTTFSYHITMWPSEQTNQEAAQESTSGAASANNCIQNFFDAFKLLTHY